MTPPPHAAVVLAAGGSTRLGRPKQLLRREGEALEALASSGHRFVGLLGPRRRREDLFRLLPAEARAALEPRLHSPVGLDLGGQGAEAIALSIAAQLQAFRDGR